MDELLDIYGLEEAFGGQDVTSPKMRRGIAEWFRLYYEGEAEKGMDPCLRIPYTVVRKLSRAVFAEHQTQTEGPFTAKALRGLDKCRAQALELALIGGESYLKPVTDGENWFFRVLSRRDLLIFGRDAMGELTDVGLLERSRDGRMYYTLLERRYVRDGFLTVENKLYRSGQQGLLGRQVALSSHPVYGSLPEKFIFPEPWASVGLVRLKNPAANCVDGSGEGVSLYAPAVGLLRNLARNEALLSGEFERGQSRIVVSSDMLREGALADNIFVGLDENPSDVGITVFAPQLREQSYLNRKQSYLRDVENVLGLKRGLLANVDEVQRTATEITTSQGEYALTIMDFQRMWQESALEAVALCRFLGKCYGKETDEAAVTFSWGDGVVWSGE